MILVLGMSGIQWVLCLITVAVCLLLIVVILLQRGRGGGLAAAFGGGGGGSAFGAKTGDVFTVITVVLAGIFLTVAVGANFVFVPPEGSDAPAPVVASPTSLPPIDLPPAGTPDSGPINLPVTTPVTDSGQSGAALPASNLPTDDPAGQAGDPAEADTEADDSADPQ